MSRKTRASFADRAKAAKEHMETIAREIIEPMTRGDLPEWSRPWKGLFMPYALSLGGSYTGRWNRLSLLRAQSMHGFETPVWGGFKDMLKLGQAYAKSIGSDEYFGVQKGQSAAGETFRPSSRRFTRTTTDAVTGVEETKTYGYVEFYLGGVFNLAQTNIPADWVRERIGYVVEPIETDHYDGVRALIAETLPDLTVTDGEVREDRAYYQTLFDSVALPPAECFSSDEARSAVLLHEAAHATGHASRLSREGITGSSRFGSVTYAGEEIVAEVAAVIAASVLGITYDAPNHAAYLAGWANRLCAGGDIEALAPFVAQAMDAAMWVLEGRPPERDAPKTATGSKASTPA